jgi:hypothetical protein
VGDLSWVAGRVGCLYPLSAQFTVRLCPLGGHHQFAVPENGSQRWAPDAAWQLPAELEFEAYAGAAGQGFAAELLGFLQIYRSLPDPKLILLDPQGASVPTDPATLYAVCSALARLAKPENMDALVTYANRLPDEFSVFDHRQRTAKSCHRKHPGLCHVGGKASWRYELTPNPIIIGEIP